MEPHTAAVITGSFFPLEWPTKWFSTDICWPSCSLLRGQESFCGAIQGNYDQLACNMGKGGGMVSVWFLEMLYNEKQEKEQSCYLLVSWDIQFRGQGVLLYVVEKCNLGNVQCEVWEWSLTNSITPIPGRVKKWNLSWEQWLRRRVSLLKNQYGTKNFCSHLRLVRRILVVSTRITYHFLRK